MEEILSYVFFIIIGATIWYFIRLKGKSKSEIEFNGNIIDKTIKNSQELIFSNVTKLKKTTQKSISKSYLTGCSWLFVNNLNESENIIYTFRTNNELLVTKNGLVDKKTYELIIDNNSILITQNNITEHYNIVNIQDDFLLLQKLSSENLQIFANQTKFKDVIKNEIKKMAKEKFKSNNYEYEFDIETRKF